MPSGPVSGDAMPCQSIAACMNQEFLLRVVQQALDARTAAPEHLSREMKAAIRDAKLRPRGFQHHPDLAPSTLLAPGLVMAFRRRPSIAAAVLHCWSCVRKDLAAAVRTFAGVHSLSVVDECPIDGKFALAWAGSELQSWTDRFLAVHSNWDRDDVALMLCLTHGACCLPENPRGGDPFGEDPLGETAEDDTSAALPDPWAGWLAELRELPADSPAWDYSGAFVLALSELSETRLEERSAPERALASGMQALEGLESALIELEIPWTDWTPAVCPRHQVEAAADELKQLATDLTDYATAVAESPQGIHQRSASLARQQALLTQIGLRCDKLHGWLRPTEAATAEPDDLWLSADDGNESAPDAERSSTVVDPPAIEPVGPLCQHGVRHFPFPPG